MVPLAETLDAAAIQALERLGVTWWNTIGWPILGLGALWIMAWAWSRKRKNGSG